MARSDRSYSGGKADGKESRVHYDLVTAAVELADMVLNISNRGDLPNRALVLAATISGLMGTKAGQPNRIESTAVLVNDLVVGNLYIGHNNDGEFSWEYLGAMFEDSERFRLRRLGQAPTIELYASHGLVLGGAKGCWTLDSGLSVDSIKQAMSSLPDIELPEDDKDVFGN